MTKTKKRIPARKPSKRKAVARQMASPEMKSYLNMLSDPCTGPFATPPYASNGTGYFYRARNLFNVDLVTTSGNTIGNPTKGYCTVMVTPGQFENQIALGAGGNDGAVYATALQVITVDPGIIFSSVCDSYRAVASCLRFIPTGNYASRSGAVGRVYSSSSMFTNSSGPASSDLTKCAAIDPCGSVDHEIKWLPGPSDSFFHPKSLAYNTESMGTMGMVLQGVDATFTAANRAQVNGYFELTTVYEWIPAGVTGVPPVKPPPRFTLQQALNAFGDRIMEFLYGITTNKSFVGLLTKGVEHSLFRHPASQLRIEL